MANKKITELPNSIAISGSDVFPLVDASGGPATEKRTIDNLVTYLGTIFVTSGGLSDGDKGDVTVSGSGSVWTIDNGTVTLAKQADMATGSLVYRKTAGAGAPEVQTLATLKTDLGLTGANSGDQTSIAGITGTKAQFNTAVTDGDFLYAGDVTTNATHTGDVTGATALTIANDVVTNAKLANMGASTFKGRVTASTGDPEDMTATQATSLLNTFTTSLKGLVPASGGGTTNFLRADGTFAAPPGGGGSGDVVGPASATDNALAVFDGTTGKLIKNSNATIVGSNLNVVGDILPVTSDASKLGSLSKVFSQVYTHMLVLTQLDSLNNSFSINNQWSNSMLDLVSSNSSVNMLELTSSIATQPLLITALGEDANIDINIIPKGSGQLKLNGIKLSSPSEYFIAASNATTREKARADYLCDGTADQVEINTALDLIRASGGKVTLSSGTFAIAASINMLGNVAESDGNPFIQLLGSGSESTTLVGASNVNVIATGQRAKYEMAYYTIRAAGSGDCISQTAGTERGNWQSWIHDVYLQGNFVDHTGWGLDMQSPFRMLLTNIEMNGVANGARLTCQTNSFNPGNLTIDRMFIDLWDNASNSNAVGLRLSTFGTDSTGVMNLVSVKRLDIAGGVNLTNSIGIDIVGSTSSYGDSRHHSFESLNIEDVKTVIKMTRGRDCTFTDLNYCRVLSGGTFIDLNSNSHNNSFENAYVLAQSTGQTFNLIVDNNTSENLPNRLIRVDGYQQNSTTINATLANSTILEQIDLSANSPTIDSDITNRNNSRRFKPRAETITSSATPGFDTNFTDHYSITALATNISYFGMSGSGFVGQKIWIDITGTAARTISWGGSFEASTIALPTTTVSTNRLDMEFIWNPATSKWRIIRVV